MVYRFTEHQFADSRKVLRLQDLLLIPLTFTSSRPKQRGKGGRLVHKDRPEEIHGHGHLLDRQLVLPT